MLLAGAIVLVILAADQILKFWVKTNMIPGTAGEIRMIGDWFKLHFTENDGMAFGLELPGTRGKLILTLFRLVAVTGIIYYLWLQAKLKATTSTIVLLALILGGALGNIIDSIFYGQWFTDGGFGLSEWSTNDNGYASYFHGKVVDMFYFPLFDGTYPEWVPFKGGRSFTFFSAIFNIADAAISIGLFAILLFKRSLFNSIKEVEQTDASPQEVAS
ncbi:MAG: signal peptidase II [Bacteroidia bacterium]|jgi:signal peptidase II